MTMNQALLLIIVSEPGKCIPVCTFCFYWKLPHAMLGSYTDRFTTQLTLNMSHNWETVFARARISRAKASVFWQRHVLVLHV